MVGSMAPFFTLTTLNKMKKFFALCSMIVALGFVAGCSGGGSSSTTPTSNPATSTDATDTSGDSETPAEGENADE